MATEQAGNLFDEDSRRDVAADMPGRHPLLSLPKELCFDVPAGLGFPVARASGPRLRLCPEVSTYKHLEPAAIGSPRHKCAPSRQKSGFA